MINNVDNGMRKSLSEVLELRFVLLEDAVINDTSLI